MKNKERFYLITLAIICMLSSCAKAQTKSATQNEQVSKDKNILIVYLSRTKNTKAVAEMIHKSVGGTLLELELKNPYPENYKEIVVHELHENETGFLPPLKTKIDSIGKYDFVFFGFPTWGMQLPPPMKSFLTQYDLSGKTVVPFNTNAGYGIGNSFETIKTLCPHSTILEGFSTKGGKERDGILFVMEGEKEKQVQTDVQEWLQKIIK